MKKITTILICIITMTVGSSYAADYMFSGTFKLNFSDDTKIRVGSAVENKSSNEWKSGSKVGNKEITPEVYSKMKDSAAETFKVEIAEKGMGNIREIWITDLSTDQRVKGVYDIKKRGFSVGKSKKAGENKIETGVIKGYFNDDFSKIINGEYQIGFLAGKAPLVVAADATFFYEATAIDKAEVDEDKETDTEEKSVAPVKKTKDVQRTSHSGGIINKWKVGMHKKGWVNISHPNTDFVEFAGNGVYTHSLKGHEEKGKWVFNNQGDEVIIKGDKEVTWNYRLNKDGNVVLTKGDETMILKPF